MISRVLSIGLLGIDGYTVCCECDLSGGLPAFDVVGLPDAAVKESRERVRSAIKNCGFEFPLRRITVNLAPADTRKEGALYDLPIMLGLLERSGQISKLPDDAVFVGELSLEGSLRPVMGALSMAGLAQSAGLSSIFLPACNASEASLTTGIKVYPVHHVRELLEHLSGKTLINPTPPFEYRSCEEECPDFSDVMGQENVKRAMEIAATGGHNILLIGPPGSGKSMLSRRLPSILPSMSLPEAIETTKIHSVAGLTSRENPILTTRPFRSPHHTISAIGLSGGGRIPRPGEISLAHNGVLFLDELPEFSRDALEVLRQPMEDGIVTISRVSGTLTFPSRFMLVCAMNPCKCGWYGHPSNRCRCTQSAVDAYTGRISGPLYDRIGIHVEVPQVKFDDLQSRTKPESSAEIRKRVNAARKRQLHRFRGTSITCNSHMNSVLIRNHCQIDAEGQSLLRDAFFNLNMTARSHDKILTISRTIADLAESENILVYHIAEALQYRGLDRTRS